MKNDAEKFIACLDEAELLLKKYPTVSFTGADLDLKCSDPERFSLALFDQWSTFCEQEVCQKPKIRIIQHMACSGGTLIAKCLAAMPNVALLSEVNPLSQLMVNSHPRFAPTDLTYLANYGKFPLIDELSEKIFRADIDVITRHIKQLGKSLLIREHSHSDYLVGAITNNYSTCKRLLKDDYQIFSVLTVRHPIDSYLSLKNNGWIQYSPATFDEYCRRYLLFIEHNEDLSVHKYEDFVNDPARAIQILCEVLCLPYNEDFQDVFDLNIMSGDSGRSSNIISKRKRRDYDEGFIKEAQNSNEYLLLCRKLNYEIF